MKLPIKGHEQPAEPAPLCFDEFDGWGGASRDGVLYVRECVKGRIVKKSTTKPYKRGIVNNEQVFYYLSIGDVPPAIENMIPSIWSKI